MELIFTALVIFLLLLPGIIFNYSYLKGFGRRNGPIAIKKYSEYLVHATIYALLLNVLWGKGISFVLSHISSIRIDWDIVSLLLLSEKIQSQQIVHVSNHLLGISLYLLGLYGISAFLGTILHRYVRWQKLDKRSAFFRPDDLWHYMLTGEIIEFPGSPIREECDDSSGPVAVFLTAVVTHGDKPYLYSGFVMDFGYTRGGEISWIALLAFDRNPFEDAYGALPPMSLIKRGEENRKDKPRRQLRLPFIRQKNNEDDSGNDADNTLNSFIVLKYNEVCAITLTYLRIQPSEYQQNLKKNPAPEKRDVKSA